MSNREGRILLKDFRTLREPSVPPPPPPPPPQKPIRIERSVEPSEVVARSTAPLPQMDSYHERREEKKEHKAPRGVPEMAKEVMAELSGRLSRGPSAQREMTQSCHPDMPEWKDENRLIYSGKMREQKFQIRQIWLGHSMESQ